MRTDAVATDAPVPAAVAERIVRAVDRSPSTVVTLVDADFKLLWASQSSVWITGNDPAVRVGQPAFARIHRDDVARLHHGFRQLQEAGRGSHPAAIPGPVRYRYLRPDGEWIVMEAIIHNLLDDPAVRAMLVFSRPVGGRLDGVGHVIDRLVAGAPLPEVLSACAGLVSDIVGSVAVVAFVGERTVVGVAPGSRAERLVGDPRWWESAVSGEAMAPTDFAGFPDDLVARARAERFRSAWVLPIREEPSGDVMGCLVAWVRVSVEHNIATDEALSTCNRVARLVIGEERRRVELERRATTDPLTGLANRSGLDARLREATGPVSVAILDLDDFKPVNDTYGHDTGDAVLRVVGERLRAAVRAEDTVVRFGGDEFAVVFAEGVARGDTERSCARLVRAIGEPIALEGGLVLTVGASVGVATDDAATVVGRADAALYGAKRARDVKASAGG